MHIYLITHTYIWVNFFSHSLKLVFFLNAYETGVWNWSMKLAYETEVWNAYETGVWNGGCSWIQHQHILDASMDCMQGYIYAWIHGSCMGAQPMTDWDNWYETGVKLTWSWHTTGLAVYIYVIHILSYSFLGGKTLLSWRWAVHDELELEESDVSVLDSTRYMAAVMRCCFTRLCSWKRSCAKICCSSVSRRVVIWVTRCFCRSRRRASVFKGSGSFSGFWFL